MWENSVKKFFKNYFLTLSITLGNFQKCVTHHHLDHMLYGVNPIHFFCNLRTILVVLQIMAYV